MIKEQTGDIAMMRPYPGREKMLHKGILLIANHTHDEIVDCHGLEPMTGCAEPPIFHMVPFRKRIKQVQNREILMATFRWKNNWSDIDNAFFKEGIHRSLRLMSLLRIKYDHKALRTHARNYIRSILRRKLKLDIPHLTAHEEDKVFCTESCRYLYRANHIDFWKHLPKQPLIAPCHMERLFHTGHLQLVQDYGLVERL